MSYMEEKIHTSVAKQMWLPYSYGRLPRRVAFPPRLKQLGQLLKCWLYGHQWSPWQIDDWDGPLDFDDFGSYPLTMRPARCSEPAIRTCQAHCGTVQYRLPAHTISEV